MSTAPAVPALGTPDEPQLEVVRQPPRRHPLLFLILGLVIVGATIFLAVGFNALSAGDAVQARSLEREVAEQERRYELLLAEVSELESPSRITREALNMGMIRAENRRHLVVNRNLPSDSFNEEVEPDEEADPIKDVLVEQR